MKNKFSHKDNEELNDKLSDFLKLILSYFCGYCGALTKKNNDNWPHHEGIVNGYIKSEKEFDSDLSPFFNDLGHGLFHGLMTSFCAYLVSSPETRKSFEKAFSSCLLHDFVKSTKAHRRGWFDKHDKILIKYFPRLLKETYEHKNPAEKYSDSSLVIADRLELMRYRDYEFWTDQRLNLALDKLSQENRKLIRLFYASVRPALEKIYNKKDSLWIAHGIEKTQDKFNENSLYPHPNSCFIPPPIQNNESYKEWAASESVEYGEYYPINHDRFPFSPAGKNEPSFGRLGFCSNHSHKFSWNKFKGLITVEDFRSKGKIIESYVREHLYATSNISLKEWTFIYSNLDSENSNAQAQYPPEISNAQITEVVENVLNSGARVVSHENVYLLWVTTKLISDRIILMNLENLKK